MSDEAAAAETLPRDGGPETESETAPSPTGPGIFLGAVALLVLYAASFGLAFVLPGAPHSDSAQAEAGASEESGEAGTGESTGTEAKDWPRELYDVPVLVVNLTGARGKRYLRIGITIQYAARDLSKAKELLESHLVPLRDRLISRISSETLETVDDPERKERLKLDILAGVREICFREAGDAAVLRIYFRDFIIQ